MTTPTENYTIDDAIFDIEDYVGGNIEGRDKVDSMGFTVFLRKTLESLVSQQPTEPSLEWYLKRLPHFDMRSFNGIIVTIWYTHTETDRDYSGVGNTPLQAAKALYEKLKAEKIL